MSSSPLLTSSLVDLGLTPIEKKLLSGALQADIQFVEVLGTSYTTTDNDNGKILLMLNPAASTLTIHDTAPQGFNIGMRTKQDKQDTVVVVNGTIFNSMNQFKTAGLNSLISIVVESNTGTDPQIVLDGDTA